MGAELSVSFVEFPKGATPNWHAAQVHLDKMTLAECYQALEEHFNYVGGLPEKLNIEKLRERAASNKEDRKLLDEIEMNYTEDPRKRLQDALNSCEEGWNGNEYCVQHLYGAKTELLIGGGVSWGDTLDELDDISLFDVSGMAKAAGALDFHMDETVVI
jgi:hypothetical protein